MGNTLQHLEVDDFELDERYLHWGPTDEEITFFMMFWCDHLYWVSKEWKKIDIQTCLSRLLKCVTTDWEIEKLCKEVEKCHPGIVLHPDRHKENKYWIRKKRDDELYGYKNS